MLIFDLIDKTQIQRIGTDYNISVL